MLLWIRASESAEPARTGTAAVSEAIRGPFTRVAGRAAGVIGFVLVITIVVAALLAPWLATWDPFALSGPSLSKPSLNHIMGTDAIGRDLLSGLLYGARTSLLIAAAVGIIAGICGVTIGMLAGYKGGITDDFLMRMTEVFQVIPRFFLAAVAIALFGPGVSRIILVLGLTSWPVLARVVRAEILTTKQLDFVLASEALGASKLHLFRHVLLPQVLPAVLVLLGLLMGQVLLTEASLGFVGLGDPNVMTWGMLAGQAQGFFRVAWWLAVFPGITISAAVLGFNLIADALSSAVQRR
ncbi:MAG: ABC transporter permease [Gemmatimonadales bacterium]